MYFSARFGARGDARFLAPIALKLLNETCRSLPGALQALQREAKAQTLSHPNIVTVFDFDRDGEDAFITMEYLKGESLKDYLRKQQKLSLKEGHAILEKLPEAWPMRTRRVLYTPILNPPIFILPIPRW